MLLNSNLNILILNTAKFIKRHFLNVNLKSQLIIIDNTLSILLLPLRGTAKRKLYFVALNYKYQECFYTLPLIDLQITI